MAENSLTYPYEQVLASISLSAERRLLIEERYLRLLRLSHRRCRQMAWLFHVNRVVITIGSIIVPALLSIQYTDVSPITTLAQGIHWTAWTLSLCVTISNGIMTMFKLDKKYYLLHASFEQLKTEGWQYLALAGNYRGNGSAAANTHETQFISFCQTIERIRMRQMEEEYIKLQEVHSSSNSQGGGASALPVRRGSGVPIVFDYQRTPGKGDPLHQFFTFLKTQYESIPAAASSVPAPLPPSPSSQSYENSIVEIGDNAATDTKADGEITQLPTKGKTTSQKGETTSQKGPTLS